MHLKELVDPSFLIVAMGVMLMRVVGLCVAHFVGANDLIPKRIAYVIEKKIEEFLSIVLEYIIEGIILFLEHMNELCRLNRLPLLFCRELIKEIRQAPNQRAICLLRLLSILQHSFSEGLAEI